MGVGSIRCCLFGSGWVAIPGLQQAWEGDLLSASEGTACAQKQLLSGAFLRWASHQVPPPVADHLPGHPQACQEVQNVMM